VKVNLSLCLTNYHATKTYCGSGGSATRILNLGNSWSEWSASLPGRLTCGGKSPRGSQSRSGRFNLSQEQDLTILDESILRVYKF